MVGYFDVERFAIEMRTAARLGPRDVPGASLFALALLGPGRVFLVPPEEVWGRGEATHDGLILVRDDLLEGERDFVIFHECAEIWVARVGVEFGDFRAKESACNAVAAALQAPPEAFHQAVDELGSNLVALAEDFRSTQTAMALRLGEVVQLPVKVERPGLTRTRGPAYAWELGARKVEITDAPSRWAFLAA